MLIDGRLDATSRRSSRSIRQSLSLTILMENRWKINRKSLSNLVLHQIRLENRSWERFCLHLTLWGVLLGAPGGPWATLGAPLGDLGALQGCPGSLLGFPRGSLGTLRGPTWDPPGLPGPPGVDLGRFWPPKTMKNLSILVGFCIIFRRRNRLQIRPPLWGTGRVRVQKLSSIFLN